MWVGIAGVDENKRTHQARLAISGEAGGASLAGARFGMNGLGVPPLWGNDRCVLGAERAGSGMRGNPDALTQLGDAQALKDRDARLSSISSSSERLGDRVARRGWSAGVWFADFTYLTTRDMRWRRGREVVFGRRYRELPLFVDSCGYRREISGTAPHWAHDFDVYPAALELLDPDGYVAWDYPDDRQRTLEVLRKLAAIFPGDERLWPVFSVRWTWDDAAHLSFAKAPGWAGGELARFIPLTRTQRPYKRETRERWARQAIANALIVAEDADFRWMAETFGKIMVGGLIRSRCARMARHLFAATVASIFPDLELWLLGQANFAVVNGLGMLGYLDRVSVDGSWWLRDATADRFAILENQLITMLSLEGKARSFFTLIELMAANLRSLLAAYAGEIEWPPMHMPVNLVDLDQRRELKRHYRVAATQLRLDLGQEG
jgi:hypothetical protein